MCGLSVQILLGSVYLLLDVSTRVCQPHIPAEAWTTECHFNDCVYFVFVCNHLSNRKVSECWFRHKKRVLIINDCILYQEESILDFTFICCEIKCIVGVLLKRTAVLCIWVTQWFCVCDVNVSYCSDLRFTFIQIGWFVSEFGLCTL